MSLIKNISTKTKKLANKILMVALVLMFNLSAVIGLGFAKINTSLLFASNIVPTKASISNPSFSSYSGSSPRTPTSWTKIVTDNSVISGVVDIDDTKTTTTSLKLNSTIKEYDGMSEDYVLLMNAPEVVSKMGYRSSEFTLDRNSFYVISFKAYAENGTYGSAYLSGEDLKGRTDNYFNITTAYEYEKEVDDGQGGTTTEKVKSAIWKTCYFLISTDHYFDSKVTLDLRLGNELAGSKGAVLFDDVSINKYAQSDFITLENSLAGNNQSISHKLDLRNATGTIEFSDNFEDQTLSNWEKVKDCDADNAKSHNGFTYLGANLDTDLTGITDSVSNQGIYYNNTNKNIGAFYINNTENLTVGYKLKESKYLTIKQNSLYLLTFDVFTGSITGEGGVKAKIYAENKDGTYEVVSTLDKISTDKKWTTYSFAINSNGFKDTKAYIEFSVENATGYAIFDNLQINQVSYELYNKYLTNNSSNCQEADVSFVKSTELNNYFNKTYYSENLPTNVYKAQKWTHTKYDKFNNKLEESNNTVGFAGVVNTETWGASGLTNPGDPNYKNYSTTSNNILVVNNITQAKQVLKSSTFSVSSGKCYEISFQVKTQGDAYAGVKVFDSSDNILYENLFIKSEDWQTQTINIVGAKETKTVYFELILGANEPASGVAYFDNLKTTDMGSSDNTKLYSEIFANATQTNVLDLSKTNFANVDTLSETDGIYTARDWKYAKQAKVNIGVVDTLNFSEIANIFGLTNPNTPEGIKNINSKLFMIDSAFDGYYTVTNNNSIVLEKDKYYKLSFWVKTQDIPQNDSSLNYNYGASIKVTDPSVKLGKTFSGINTQGVWKEYVLYLNTIAESSVENYNLTLTLALGSENLQSTGTVFFSEIIAQTLEQAEFDAAVLEQEKSANDSVITFVGSSLSAKSDNDSTEETTPETNAEGGFSFLYFSSILTAVVVLLAVIAFALKSLKIRRPVKIKAQDLNKERMSARNFAFKDKMIEINNRLAVLDDKLFETNKAIDDLIYERSTDSDKMQELKNQKAETLEQMKQAKQEENELVEQFKRFKKDEKLRKNHSKNK